MTYLNDIYLEPWFSWFGGGMQKTFKKIQGKSNNNNPHLWFYLLYKTSYFARKT